MLKKIYFKSVFFGILLVVSFGIFFGCNSDDTTDFNLSKSVDFDVFTLETPPDWTRFDQQGIDTFIGGLTNGVDTLYFDYGYLSFGSLDNIKENSETLSFQALRIHGYDAKIVKEKRAEELKVRYSVYLDKRDKTNLNRIYGYGLENEELIRAMFLTHRFK